MKGHIYKRGKTYTYVVDLGKDHLTNKRLQKTKGGFRTKKEAESALADILSQNNKNEIQEDSEINLKNYRTKWFDTYKIGLCSGGKIPKASTLKSKNNEWNRIEDYFKDIKLKNISKEQYQKFLFNMFEKYKYNTLVNTHKTARMIFKSATNDKLIKNNPADGVIIPKKQQTIEDLENKVDIPKYFEKEELIEFLNFTKQYPEPLLYAAFLTLAHTGIRIGELCALKWRDIDFENGEINIYKTIFCPGKTINYILQTPKTKSSIRNISIDNIVIETLKNYKTYQDLFSLRIPTWHPEDFIFTKFFKNPGYPETVKQLELKFDELINKGSFKKLTPHSLRHTHVSLLAEVGVRLEEIMERLGHSNDKTTKNIYLHVTKTMKKDASNKFEQLMQSIS